MKNFPELNPEMRASLERLSQHHRNQHEVVLYAPGYECLAGVLHRAFTQAAAGKGKERHAQGAAFDQQPMQQLIDLYGPGFALGQAGKKAQESQRLPHDRAVAELLGAINYLAGAVVAMERRHSVHDTLPSETCGQGCAPKTCKGMCCG